MSDNKSIAVPASEDVVKEEPKASVNIKRLIKYAEDENILKDHGVVIITLDPETMRIFTKTNISVPQIYHDLINSVLIGIRATHDVVVEKEQPMIIRPGGKRVQ